MGVVCDGSFCRMEDLVDDLQRLTWLKAGRRLTTTDDRCQRPVKSDRPDCRLSTNHKPPFPTSDIS